MGQNQSTTHPKKVFLQKPNVGHSILLDKNAPGAVFRLLVADDGSDYKPEEFDVFAKERKKMKTREDIKRMIDKRMREDEKKEKEHEKRLKKKENDEIRRARRMEKQLGRKDTYLLILDEYTTYAAGIPQNSVRDPDSVITFDICEEKPEHLYSKRPTFFEPVEVTPEEVEARKELEKEKQLNCESWAKQHWPIEFRKPEKPVKLVRRSGMRKFERYRLSQVIHDVTRATHIKPCLDHNTIKPFIIINRTDAKEIMRFLGSRRLNAWHQPKEAIDYVDYHIQKQGATEFIETIEAAGIPFESYREHPYARINNVTITESTLKIDHIDKSHPRDMPYVGLPPKQMLWDLVDLPLCSVEVLREMNMILDQKGIQIIDLRSCSEMDHRREHFPLFFSDERLRNEVVPEIKKSLSTLRGIQLTADYFVVHIFYYQTVPHRFHQAIIRFTPKVNNLALPFKSDGQLKKMFFSEAWEDFDNINRNYNRDDEIDHYLQLQMSMTMHVWKHDWPKDKQCAARKYLLQYFRVYNSAKFPTKVMWPNKIK